MIKKTLFIISLLFSSFVPYLFVNKTYSAPGLIEPKGTCCVFMVTNTSNQSWNECFGKENSYNCTPEDAKRFLIEKKGYKTETTGIGNTKFYNGHNCYYDKTSTSSDKYYCSIDGNRKNYDDTKMKQVQATTNTNIKDSRVKSNLSQKGLVPEETGYLMDNCIKDGNCSVCAILATFAYAINWLFKIGVLGAFLMVTRYGIMLLTSAGNETKVKDGKNGIKGTLIGIIVLFSGWTIVDTVLVSFVGGDAGQSSIQETWNRSIFNDGTKWYQFCQVNMKK